MSYPRKHRPFIALSRRQRRKKVLALKNLIDQERHRCGGVFYDECDVSQYGLHSDAVWQWSDICFVGKDPAVLWNAEIITTQVAFRDEVYSRAFDHASRQLSDLQREAAGQIESRPDYHSSGKIISRTLVSSPQYQYPVFGGRTFLQYVQHCEEDIARHRPPTIYCRYQFLPGFAYGLGLRMIVDSPALSQQVIEQAIAHFRALGEKEWSASSPASFSPST